MQAAPLVADSTAEPVAVAAAPQRSTAGQADNRAASARRKVLQRAIDASPRQQAAAPPRPVNRTGLPDQLKTGVESLSGMSLDGVRVHYNSAKPAQLQAHAYAQGTDIHVAPGQEQHLPHEAWHVVQQQQGRVRATTQLKGRVPVNDNAGLEREADKMGALALRLGPTAQLMAAGARATRLATAPVVQRQALTKFIFAQQEPPTGNAQPAAPQVLDVIIGGRTPSPFGGTMGAHSTAWVAHLDAIRRQLVNRSLVDGATALIALAREELASGLNNLRDLLSEPHKKLLAQARASLETAISSTATALTPSGPPASGTAQMDEGGSEVVLQSTTPAPDVWWPLVQATRQLVNELLTYVNYLPGATVAGGDPSGHGEGSARSDLNMFEAVAARHEQWEQINQENAALRQELDRLGVDEEVSEEHDIKQQQYTANENKQKNIRKEQNSVVTKGGKKESKAEKKLARQRKKEEGGSLPHVLKKVANERFRAPDIDPTAHPSTRKANEQKREVLQRLREQVRARLWNLFAGETPTVLARGASGSVNANQEVEIWGLMVRNFLRTIRTAYPYAYQFAQMDTTAAQQAGLNASIAESGLAPSSAVQQAVLQDLNDNPVADAATVRPDHSGVAASDLQQSGSGFQANVLVGSDDRIGDVVMNGRTPSPFSGTMGAHTTAWTVHIDAIRRSLSGQLLQDAFQILKAKALKEMSQESEVLKLSNKIDEKHQVKLLNAYTVLKNRNGKVAGYTTLSTPEQAAHLEEYIREYLTLINFLPMSTISVGYMPNGRSEGQHRTFLNNYENQGSEMLTEGVDSEDLQGHLKGLFDSKALDYFPPDLVMREKSDFSQNIGMPYKEHDLYGLMVAAEKDDKKNQLTLARQRLYESLLEAYPRAMMDSKLLERKQTGVKVLSHEKQEIDAKERDELQGMLHQNNCLINAIVGGGALQPLTYEQLLEIRLRIGSLGTMLVANARVISIIRSVLGIQRGIVVQYTGGAPAEDFGNTDDNPIFIHHTGADHFAPGPLLVPQQALGVEESLVLGQPTTTQAEGAERQVTLEQDAEFYLDEDELFTFHFGDAQDTTPEQDEEQEPVEEHEEQTTTPEHDSSRLKRRRASGNGYTSTQPTVTAQEEFRRPQKRERQGSRGQVEVPVTVAEIVTENHTMQEEEDPTDNHTMEEEEDQQPQ